METPEKLYVDVTDNPNDVWLRAFRQPFKKCGVEYTRTDAFIEKALKFLDGNFFFNNIRHSIESGVFDSMEEMYKDFKKYMKGE